ncbi:MAG: hypothetical protein QM736_08485 [Vicinamibacterales bacterium]
MRPLRFNTGALRQTSEGAALGDTRDLTSPVDCGTTVTTRQLLLTTAVATGQR